MKIECDFDESSPIALLHKIPDAPRLKLLGYNGIGKTLTANILASISGESIWTQEQIDSLAKFLPYFITTIHLDSKTYTVEATVKNWKVDHTSGKLQPESIGTIRLHDVEVSTEKFLEDFKCYIIRGNWDILAQIKILGETLEKTILYNINSLEKKVMDFNSKVRNIQESLTQEQLSSDILRLEDLLKDGKEEIDPSVFSTINALLIEVKKTTNKEWLSTSGPNQSLNNVIQLKKQINFESFRSRIDNLHRIIPEAHEAIIKKYLDDKKEIENYLKEIEYPLCIEDYPTKKAAIDGKIETMTEIEKKRESIEKYKEHRFRREYWPGVLDLLRGKLVTGELPPDIEVLLDTDKWKALRADELQTWYYETARIGQERLERFGRYQNLLEEIKKLKEKAGKFDDHIDKLEEREGHLKDLENITQRLGRILEKLGELKELPKLEEQYRELERDFSVFQLIEHYLRSLGNFKDWSSILGKDFHPQNHDDLIHMLSYVIESERKIIIQKEELQQKKERYLHNLKEMASESKMPRIIQQLIEKDDVVSLCKIGSDLSKIMYIRILEELKKDCIQSMSYIIKGSPSEESVKQSQFISEANKYLGNQIKALLNMPAFRENVFNDSEVILVDPQKNILKYRDEYGNEYEKFIAAYSTGEKAFAYSLASIFYAKSSSPANNTLLILDEFGALLAEDKEQYLIEYLNKLQDDKKWPTQYVIVLPYKGEFDRVEYEERLGDKIKKLKNELKERGYAFEEL